ncbi:MAG: acyl carrier protein [Bacteroidetes bacterium SW_11_45_7]|nr:MAG: acyl carrier protein [Bacteroidetes bacterium SW_11_45_7]
MDRDQLKNELKQHIIKYLNLTDLSPEDISDEDPLFVEGLGLDSIDALELLVLIEREYGIKINNTKEGKEILVNVNTMADYLQKNAVKGVQ